MLDSWVLSEPRLTSRTQFLGIAPKVSSNAYKTLMKLSLASHLNTKVLDKTWLAISQLGWKKA